VIRRPNGPRQSSPDGTTSVSTIALWRAPGFGLDERHHATPTAAPIKMAVALRRRGYSGSSPMVTLAWASVNPEPVQIVGVPDCVALTRVARQDCHSGVCGSAPVPSMPPCLDRL
jgi:hypothetical protein